MVSEIRTVSFRSPNRLKLKRDSGLRTASEFGSKLRGSSSIRLDRRTERSSIVLGKSIEGPRSLKRDSSRVVWAVRLTDVEKDRMQIAFRTLSNLREFTKSSYSYRCLNALLIPSRHCSQEILDFYCDHSTRARYLSVLSILGEDSTVSAIVCRRRSR